VVIEVRYGNLVSFGKSGMSISLFLKGEQQTDDDDGSLVKAKVNRN
jgi:hypothetical protein